MQCKHTFWLGLDVRGTDADIVASDRLGTITRLIPDRAKKSPSLFVLIGNSAKTTALRELFGVKRSRHFTLKQSPAELHLHVEPSTLFGDRPVLVAEGDLSGKPSVRSHAQRCHRITRRPLRTCDRGLDTGLAISVYSRLLSPFADVFCYFSDDLGGLDHVARHLAYLLDCGFPSARPASWRPAVVVVTDKIPPGAESEREARKSLLLLVREATAADALGRLSSVDVVALFPAGAMSAEARHRVLRERLMQASDRVRKTRQDSRSLFSTTHFTAFLESACRHLSSDVAEPFNFVRAAREHNPVAGDLDQHLENFLSHIKSSDELTGFAVPAIASSLLLDNYPPNSHCKKYPREEAAGLT
jgi:hypothetical protein